MKEVKIYTNADRESLEIWANEAVNTPGFLEIHYTVHSILAIFDKPGDGKTKASPNASVSKNSSSKANS